MLVAHLNRRMIEERSGGLCDSWRLIYSILVNVIEDEALGSVLRDRGSHNIEYMRGCSCNVLALRRCLQLLKKSDD